MNEFSLKLAQKIQLTPDMLELHFIKPDGFDFQAGQFVQFFIPSEPTPALRAYSISSAPQARDLEFCVKLLPDGKASTHFIQMHEGETVKMRGPKGHFTNNHPTPMYCIATGAGMAPLMSIIQEELCYKKTDREVRLLFGVRSEEDVFWQERFEMLAKESPFFSFDITLSQPKPTGGWAGLRGRVTEHILHHLSDHHFFLCGNAAMVKDVRQILLENGIDKQYIHFEIF